MQKLIIILVVMFFISCQSGTKKKNGEAATAPLVVVEDTLNIGGMHCDMCMASIEKGVNQLEGIEFVKANLNDSTTVVRFDGSKTNLAEIQQAIEKRGYRVKNR